MDPLRLQNHRIYIWPNPITCSVNIVYSILAHLKKNNKLELFTKLLGAIHLLCNTISGLSGLPPPLCHSVSAFGLPSPYPPMA